MTTGGELILWAGDRSMFEQWSANAADDSTARLSVAGEPADPTLRFDFSLAGPGSWTIARCAIDAVLPPHYVAVLEVSGQGDPSELQLKLVDASGANVWWWRRRGFVPPPEPTRLDLRRAALEFAWGPASGGEPARLAAVELALAGERAAGTLRIHGLRIEARDVAAAHPRVQAVRASSSRPGCEPERVLDPSTSTSWRPAAGDREPWLELDLGRPSEWGGLIVDFAEQTPPCRLLASNDAAEWRCLAETPGNPRHRCWLRTADGDGRYARLAFASGEGTAVARVALAALEQAVSPARHLSAVAREAPRGRYPRHLLGEQVYWALVGAEGDEHKALLSEDGALEVDAESFSIEPFLWLDGRLLTWADVEHRLTLANGHLPMPVVEWRTADLRLVIAAVAIGAGGQRALAARYRIENTGAESRDCRLFLAVRPFQVNPSWQSLNLVGGIAPIAELEHTEEGLRVNGARTVIAVTRPNAGGAAPSEAGLRALAEGRPPDEARVEDVLGFAEGALAFDLTLSAGATGTVAIAAPYADGAALPHGLMPGDAAEWVDARLAETTEYWRARLGALPIELPPGARAYSDTLHASLGWILATREGPRIQPGARCYRRAWIRDGALMGTAIAELGFAEEARQFLRWYAQFQFTDGRVPCAVDRHGIDRAVEHDSHGQLAWGIIEVARLAGDQGFLRELWPHVRSAVEAIRDLRATRTTEAYTGTAQFGLLPESISHEGYASRPVHSYWDDFFAVRALADAAEAATELGDAQAAREIAALRDAMAGDVRASIARSMYEHGLDVLPGSAELGDFDPTSSAIALDPCGVSALLPPDGLAHTFARYWAEFEARRRGDAAAEAYTPYEIRNATALLLMGDKPRALELLDWLLAEQRPTAWRQWPEVCWRNRRAPRFFGDLPHGWVGSIFIRTLRRMLAYERRDEQQLVLAAGVPEAWVGEPPGVRVRNLPTLFGPLDYAVRAEGSDRIAIDLGPNVPRPAGGTEIKSPSARRIRRAWADGQALDATAANSVLLPSEGAREVVLEY